MDYVQSMRDIINAYGGAPSEYFTIYFESLGSGSYRIYFLYLVRVILSSTRKDGGFFIPKLRKDG